jgi:hypothetical protein
LATVPGLRSELSSTCDASPITKLSKRERDVQDPAH